MNSSRRNRRAILRAWAVAMAGGLAGCGADDSGFEDTAGESTGATDTATGTMTSETAVPQVSFDFNFGAGVLTLTHAAGDTVAVERLSVAVDGEVAFEGGAFRNGYGAGPDAENGWARDVEAGDRLVLDPRDGFPAQAETRIIWRADEQSAVLAEYELPAVQSRTAKLGLLIPETGSFQEYGPALRDAALLAVRQVDDANVPVSVDARTEDTASDPSTGVQRLQTLASDGYPAVVGPMIARTAERVAEEVAGRERTVCCPITLTTLQDSDYVFQTAPVTDMIGGALADLAVREEGAGSAAIVSVDFAFTRAIADGFADRYRSSGGTVAERTQVPFGASSFDGVIDTLLDPDPDVLIPLLYPESGGHFLEAYYEAAAGDERILLPLMLEDESIPQAITHSMDGTLGLSPGRTGSEVERRFRDVYDDEPDLLSVHAYDAAAVSLLANARAGSNDGAAVRAEMRSVANPGGRTVTPDSLAEGVAAAASGEAVAYQGAGSAVDFTAGGELQSADFRVWQYTDDSTEAVDTLTYDP